jgi:hypothetical protein
LPARSLHLRLQKFSTSVTHAAEALAEVHAMADLAAVVDTVVATVTTVAAALAVVAATLAVTARVVGLIAHRVLVAHATVAHQTPKKR